MAVRSYELLSRAHDINSQSENTKTYMNVVWNRMIAETILFYYVF